jgi:hypothetical protein
LKLDETMRRPVEANDFFQTFDRLRLLERARRGVLDLLASFFAKLTNMCLSKHLYA